MEQSDSEKNLGPKCAVGYFICLFSALFIRI